MVNINYLNQFGGRFIRSLAFFGASTVLVTLSVEEVSAQSAAVGISETSSFTPSAKALLEMRSTSKGVLIPRMSRAERLAIAPPNASPDALNNGGLLVFQHTADAGDPAGYYFWNGASWGRLLDASTAGWSISGNPSTNAGTNFLGTTDDVGLRLRTNNLERIRISGGNGVTGGNVGIGVAADAVEKLQVNGNLILSEGADRRLYVAQTTSNVPGDDLTIEAGNAPSPAGSAQPGGHLVLQAGAGYSNTNPGAGGNVVIRSGGNSYGNSPSLADQWGDIVFQTGNNGSLLPSTRLTISKLGKVTINDFANPGTKVLTADVNGQLAGLGGGTSNQVLKMNSAGNAIEWGVPAVTSLSIPANTGDILYYNGTSWVILDAPNTLPSVVSPAPTSTYWALTIAGNGQSPTWQPTDAFTVDGDDMGTHNASTRINLNGNRITNDATPTGSEGIGLDANGNVAIGVAVDAAYALKIAGKMNSNGINETSDFRFKKNIEEIPNALEIVSQMRGVTYDWRADEFPERNFSEGRDMGVIAQEVELLVPEVVSTGSDGYKAVEYGHLVGLLIEAIKEQKSIIDRQTVELTSLKGVRDELNTLKASVELLTEHIRTSQK
jgi:hypothetical protein